MRTGNSLRKGKRQDRASARSSELADPVPDEGSKTSSAPSSTGSTCGTTTSSAVVPGTVSGTSTGSAESTGAKPVGATTGAPAKKGRDPLLAGICHDLRAPLAAVTMGANFVLQTTPDDTTNARSRRVLSAILRSCKQMARL